MVRKTEDYDVKSAPGLGTNENALAVANPIADGRAFIRQGQNRYFSVEPPEIHFAGYTIGRTHCRTLRVRNISARSRRICVLPPTTSFFSVRMLKLGSVAPGMCEEITVEFTPRDHTYYYDCVRFHSEGENLSLPCHGYPVVSDVRLPSDVDFGTCAINQQVRRSIKIACKTPINFEYECTVIESHPEIEIESLCGTVSAASFTCIELIYRPVTFRTAVMRFAFRVSQFGFEPIIVVVRGNCMPGGLQQAAKHTAGHQSPAGGMLVLSRTRDSFGKPAGRTSSNFFSADSELVLGHSGGGGGGRHDLVSTHLASRQRSQRSERLGSSSIRRSGLLPAKLPSFRPLTPEQTIDGIRFPPNVLTHSAVANVLTQEKGKLRIRDLKRAVDESKQKEQQGLADNTERSQDSAEVPHSGVGRQFQETIFERKFREVEDFERSKEIKWFECTGDENMDGEETKYALDQRHHRERERANEKEENDRQRKRTELSKDRAVFMHGSLPNGVPVWPEHKTDPTRLLGMERFVNAIRIIIVRGRVENRLLKLRRLFARVGKNAQAVGELVDMWDDQEAMQRVIGGADISAQAGNRLKMRMAAETVQQFCFPSYRESGSDDLEPIDTLDTMPQFEELDTFPLKVPKEAVLMGYRIWPVPVLPFHFPATFVPQIRSGAREENVARGASNAHIGRKSAVTAASATGLPVWIILPAQSQCYAGSYAFVQHQRYQEVSVEYALRPAALRLDNDSNASKVRLNSVAESENASRGAGPVLSETWRPSQGILSAVIQMRGVRVPPPSLLDGPTCHSREMTAAHSRTAQTSEDPADSEEAAPDEFWDAANALLLKHDKVDAILPTARELCRQSIMDKLDA